MKVLVYAHQLEVGGTQTNAIELAAQLRSGHGHDVVIFATPGPMAKLIEERRLPYIAAPVPGGLPSWAMMRALSQAIRREKPDVIHVWDWWQCVNAQVVANVLHGTPIVVTDMISVGGIEAALPRSAITTFGTPERVELAKLEGRARAALLLPPIDVAHNAPGASDGQAFRAAWGVQPGEVVAITVSRLDPFLKLESIRRTIAAIGEAGRDLPLKLILVGDGDARQESQALANEVNERLGRQAVVLAGMMLDPRPAYAAADIVIGMGGSSLRGMAFSKPVVVVGERGFARTFTPETSGYFLSHGLFGTGDGGPDNSHLVEAICSVAQDAGRRRELGRFSRAFVESHFSLEAVGRQLDHYLREAVTSPVGRLTALKEAARTAAILGARVAVPRRVRDNRIARSIGNALGAVALKAK